MKTAVPVMKNSIDTKLSGHFGSAPYLAIFETEGGDPVFIDRNNHGSCASVEALTSQGVKQVISLGMGRGAMNHLSQAGISYSFIVKSPHTLEQFISALKEGEVILSEDAGVCTGHGGNHHAKQGDCHCSNH